MRVIKEIYRQFDSFDGRLFRYALAFSLLLAIAPILIALILVFQNSIILNEGAADALVAVLIQYLPRDIIVPFVEWFSSEGEPIGFWATISTLAISFYLASRSIYSFLLISAQVEKVKAAHRLLTEDLERHYTIAELSERFSIPATALKECFKSVYGQPVGTYMRNLRMDRAALLLRQKPQTSVAEIAGRVGYDSASKFAAVFREAKGKTPLEYRREGR